MTDRYGKGFLRKCDKVSPLDPAPERVAKLVRSLIEKGFHGKVEISIHQGTVTAVNIDSKIPFDKISEDNIICFKL